MAQHSLLKQHFLGVDLAVEGSPISAAEPRISADLELVRGFPRRIRGYKVKASGLEPETYGLKVRCSTN